MILRRNIEHRTLNFEPTQIWLPNVPFGNSMRQRQSAVATPLCRENRTAAFAFSILKPVPIEALDRQPWKEVYSPSSRL